MIALLWNLVDIHGPQSISCDNLDNDILKSHKWLQIMTAVCNPAKHFRAHDMIHPVDIGYLTFSFTVNLCLISKI